MAFENREMAAFNLAMPYLIRVNSILNSNYTAFIAGDQRKFLINLRQLYRELVPWLVVNEKKKIDDTKDFKEAFTALSKINKHARDEIWQKMEDIENLMRIQFKLRGMLMPKVSDPRALFGNKQK